MHAGRYSFMHSALKAYVDECNGNGGKPRQAPPDDLDLAPVAGGSVSPYGPVAGKQVTTLWATPHLS